MIPRPSLNIGIEEEYQIVDPETRAMRSFITQFLDNDRVIMIEREIKPELHASMVELGTPICPTVADAKEELVKQRSFIARLARDRGVEVVAAATHPERAHLLQCETGQAIREEIAVVVPFYYGIQRLQKTGDAFQYGGRHLCAGGKFPTADGKAHFRAVALPNLDRVPGEFEVRDYVKVHAGSDHDKEGN